MANPDGAYFAESYLAVADIHSELFLAGCQLVLASAHKTRF
jgi:hypothetical protein